MFKVWLRRIAFGKAGYAGVFGLSAAAIWASKELFQEWLWSVVVSIGRNIFGWSLMTGGQTAVVVIFAVLVGLCVLVLFGLGVWWEKKRRPEFFADRAELEAAHRVPPLESVISADCVWLIGQTAFHGEEHLEKIKRLVLPNPLSESLKRFQKSGPKTVDLEQEIFKVTKVAQEHNIGVKWYPEFTGQSWWIGNRDKDNSFVHIECLIPYSLGNRRPSFRVYRWQDEEFYIRYCKIFDTMWDNSCNPNLDS